MKSVVVVAWLCLVCSNRAMAQEAAPIDVLVRVLNEYRSYSEFFDYLPAGKDSFPVRTKEVLSRLEPKVLASRYAEFNGKFLNFKKTLKVFVQQKAILQKRFDETPLSDIKNKSQIDIRLKVQTQRVVEARRTLFLISVDANYSIVDALATLTPSATKQIEKEKQAAVAPATPKMPGVYQGSRWEYDQKDAADKINITPLDKEFEDSQLGQKIQKDLGGKVDFWSYDFDTDELYVKVGDQISKLRVQEEGNTGVRFIQTRVGAGFFSPKGSDEKVDENTAKGRFLSSKSERKNETTLFGEKQKVTPSYAPEVPDAHGSAPGHDHDH